MFGILVVAGHPGPHGGCGEFHQLQQFLFPVGLVADDVDLANFGNTAFHHIKAHCDPVALQLGHSGLDRYRVFAACHINTLEFVFRFIQRRLVKNTAFGKTDKFQVVAQLVLGDILDAVDFDTGDGRTFAQYDDQHALLNLEADIGKKTGGKHGSYGGGRLVIVQSITHLDGKITEYRSSLGALYPLDTNIFHHKGLNRNNGRDVQQRDQARQFE